MNSKLSKPFVIYPLIILMVFTIFGFSISYRIHAQSTPDDILVSIIPPDPTPNEDISITLSSYSDNLDTVLITWYVNGKNILSGIGKKSTTIKAPALGVETTVVAKIALSLGEITKNIVIKPSIIILLSQANDSYTPPFYRGKALLTPGSEVKVVAMPEIKVGAGLANPKNMTYAWRKDFTNDIGASGYGKNYFTYISDYLDDSNYIEVTATTLDQKYSSLANITIGMTQPKILFYKNDSAIGTIWDRALADGHKIEDKEIIKAIPYFISPKNIRNPRLIWNWFINDSQVYNQSFQKNLMPLQVGEGTSGTSRLRVEIENLDKIFQTANKEINLEF